MERLGELEPIETHSLPALARCYPRSFTFYVAYPVRSILNSSAPDIKEAASSPSNHRQSQSPVLLVHGDDDRNLPFQQTTDLVEKLRAAQRVAFEELIFPDEIHDLLRILRPQIACPGRTAIIGLFHSLFGSVAGATRRLAMRRFPID